jgi:hypothetical protein
MQAGQASGDALRTKGRVRAQPKPALPVAALNGLRDFAWRKPLGATGGAILLILILGAIFAPWIAPHDPYQTNVAFKYATTPRRGANWCWEVTS